MAWPRPFVIMDTIGPLTKSGDTTKPSRYSTIRLASVEDVPFIEGLLAKLYSKNEHCFPGISYDQASATDSILATIEHGVVLIGPHSACGATIGLFPWNQSKMIGEIHFFAFNNAKGMTIFQAMSKMLKHLGATHIRASSHFPHFVIAKYYRRLGLQPGELSCMAPL